jgi:hypothetical protein
MASVPGCSRGPADRSSAGGEPSGEAEAAVRQRFAEVQAAVKARDAGKLWGILSAKSRADAEKEAKAIRTAYEGADATEKARLEKELGLPGEELAKLAGAGFLKTRRFLRKYNEVAESTVERVTAQGDSATVYFTEPDGDREKMAFVREDDQWRAWVAMPKARKAAER